MKPYSKLLFSSVVRAAMLLLFVLRNTLYQNLGPESASKYSRLFWVIGHFFISGSLGAAEDPLLSTDFLKWEEKAIMKLGKHPIPSHMLTSSDACHN